MVPDIAARPYNKNISVAPMSNNTGNKNESIPSFVFKENIFQWIFIKKIDKAQQIIKLIGFIKYALNTTRLGC